MHTKEKIMSTAMELFAIQGFPETSVQEIANRCGIAQTTVLYHFKSKQNLLFQLIDLVIAHNREFYYKRKTENINPVAGLVEFCQSNLTWCYHNQAEAHVLLMLFNFSKMEQALKEKATEVIDNGRDIVEKFLKDTSFDGNLRVTAVILQQYINAAMFHILVRTDAEYEYQQNLKNIELFAKRLFKDEQFS